MAAALQNIPIFVLEHKWSSDVESSVYSDEEMHDRLSLLDYSKTHSISCVHCTSHPNVYAYT